MAVNLLEENRLVYHDTDGDTLEIDCTRNLMNFTTTGQFGVNVKRDAVETLRDALTNWLETGKLAQ